MPTMAAKVFLCDGCKGTPEAYFMGCRYDCGFIVFLCERCGGGKRCKKVEQIHVNTRCVRRPGKIDQNDDKKP